MEIGNAEMTKPTRGIHHEKVSVWLSSRAPGAILPKILEDYSFPILHSSANFHPNATSFQGDMCENVSHTQYNIGVKPVGFLPTTMDNNAVHLHHQNNKNTQ